MAGLSLNPLPQICRSAARAALVPGAHSGQSGHVWSVPLRLRVVILVSLLGVVAACVNHNGGADRTEPSLKDIDYFMPSQVPSGWRLGDATQRIEVTQGPEDLPLRISDYTLIWRPDRYAGESRADSRDGAGPFLAINSGSAYYNETYNELVGAEPPDQLTLDEAQVTRTDGKLQLHFKLGCCLVGLTSEGVEEAELRSIAETLTSVGYDAWQASLGDRLLVDDQTG